MLRNHYYGKNGYENSKQQKKLSKTFEDEEFLKSASNKNLIQRVSFNKERILETFT